MSNNNSIMDKPLRSEMSIDDFKTMYTVFTALVLMYNTFINVSAKQPSDFDLTILMFLVSNFFVQRNNRYDPQFGKKLQHWINVYAYATLIMAIVIFGDMGFHFLSPIFQFLFAILGALITITFTLYTRGKSLSFDEVQVTLNSLVDELYKNFPEIVDSLSENIENNGGLNGTYGKRIISTLRATTRQKVPTDHKQKKKKDRK